MSTLSEHPGFAEVPGPTLPAATALGIRRMRREKSAGAVTKADVTRFKAAEVRLEAWRAEHLPAPASGAPAAFERQGAFLLVRAQTAVLGATRGPGVYYIEDPEDSDGEPEVRWLCSRLEPLADTRDRDNRNWGTLFEVVDNDGKSHVWAMPAEIGPTVGDGTEFRRALANRGWKSAPSTKARNRVNEYVTVWQPSRKVRCVSTVGWCGEAFVMPDATFGGNEEVVLQVEGVAPEFVTAGSLEGWRTEVAALCVGNSRLVLGASAAFAGPLLKLVGEESGGIHFLGASSIGKTTACTRHAQSGGFRSDRGAPRTTAQKARQLAQTTHS